jgi:hypothetical protein
MDKFTNVKTIDLYRVCATLECAHEWDQRERAEARLKAWGASMDEAMGELERRERSLVVEVPLCHDGHDY